MTMNEVISLSRKQEISKEDRADVDSNDIWAAMQFYCLSKEGTDSSQLNTPVYEVFVKS